MNIAVIPARGGSKRIPKKNIKLFHGKPIIYWPIKTAIESGLFDKIIVSTDNEQIGDIALKFGAEVPFMRPKRISNDFAGTNDVIIHAIKFFQNKNYELDKVCCFYPTSVFLTVNDLTSGLEALNEKKWKFSLSVTKFSHPIARSFELMKSGGLKMLYPENFNKRTQDLKDTYHDAAQFCWGRASSWTSKLKVFDAHTYPVIIPSWRTNDIDNLDDWNMAEYLFDYLKIRK